MALSTTGLTFAYRGDTTTAYFNKSLKDFSQAETANGYTITSDTAPVGCFGAKALKVRQNGNQQMACRWCGFDNFSKTDKLSGLLRFHYSATSNSWIDNYLLRVQPCGARVNDLELIWRAGGTLTFSIINPKGVYALTYTSPNPVLQTAGIREIFFSYDGSTITNALQLRLNDSVSSHNGSTTTTFDDYVRPDNIEHYSGGNNDTYFYIDEIILWDNLQDVNYDTRTEYFDVTERHYEENSDPVASNVLNGTSYITQGETLTGSYTPLTYSNPAIENVKSGIDYIYESNTLTGTYSLSSYTNPEIENVRSGVSYIYESATLTGTLSVPTAHTGASGTLSLSNIKENIRYVLDNANDVSGSPIDLSSNLSTRVKKVLKINPEKIPVQASYYPFVTVYIDNKTMNPDTIARNQLTGKRKGDLTINIAAAIWNQNFSDVENDPADNDLEYLMENIENILRAYPTLGNEVNWQEARNVSYYSYPLDEQTHLRGAILEIVAKVWY